MRTVDLNALAVFDKVVELRNFRRAARVLGVSKSTVSARVTQLEEHLGVRLLERTTRSVYVTAAGLAYHQQIAPALEAVRDGERVIAGLQAEPRGVVRIVAPSEFHGPILVDVLAEYTRRHPHVAIEAELSDRPIDLVEEGIDLALRIGPQADSSLIARKLGTPQRLRVYASATYLRRHGTPRRPAELAAHDCLVMTSHREAARWQFVDGKRTVTIEVKPRIAANSFVLLRALAAAGRGIARLPEGLVAPNHRLHALLDDYTPPARSWHVLYPSARNLPARVRILVELLQARFGA